jgi:hypothetical protein
MKGRRKRNDIKHDKDKDSVKEEEKEEWDEEERVKEGKDE